MLIGTRNFETGKRTYVTGILNVTPDSFSDGGRYLSAEAALEHALQMVNDGADIIDVGGESTRPGYERISDEEEIARIVPVIRAIKKNTDVPVSADTYKPAVARACIQAGADLINDIWGLKHDPEMAEIIADAGVSCILMHNSPQMCRGDVVSEVCEGLQESVKAARDAGIGDDKIILDPGVGFAKTCEQNLQVINSLERFAGLGFPVLLGASRKSFIGRTLDLPEGDREEGTLAASVIAVMKGCSFVRVHDVKKNVRAIRMTEKILESGKAWL